MTDNFPSELDGRHEDHDRGGDPNRTHRNRLNFFNKTILP